MICALAALAPPASARADDAEWRIDRFAWSGAAGETIEIENVFGDLRIRGAATDEVEVTAVLQHVEGDPVRLEVSVVSEGTSIGEGGSRLAISVVEGSDPAAPSGSAATAEMGRRRVDMVVMVPATAEVLAWTDAGLLEIKGVAADVTAASESGRIFLKLAGGARVENHRGDVEAVFEQVAWNRPVEISTATGEVLVWLPRLAHVAVSIETRGEISTDYSMAISRDASDDRLKRGKAQVGGGGRSLHIRSTRGRVRLLRSN